MIKILLKIFIGVVVNLFVIKSLYLNEVNKTAQSTSYIKQVYSQEDYKYWSKEDGRRFCLTNSTENLQEAFSSLNKYSSKRTNIIYLQNVDIIDCKDKIKEVAAEFHKRGLAIALDIENIFDYKAVFNDDFTKLKDDFYRNKFKDYGFINQWVDYLIFDHAMEYLTYNERRIVQADLRKVFNKTFLGFRFTRHIDGFPSEPHPNRQDKILEEFLPQDDDGDFIITSIKIPSTKRTLVFVEDTESDITGVNGEFIE